MNKADNIRSRKTEKQIEDAYFELVNRDYEHSVSVTMLCQEIGINRATFYAHFADIYELQEKLEARTTSEIISILNDKGLGDERMTGPRIVAMLEYVRDHRFFYLACFHSGKLDNPSVIDLIAKKFGADERSRYRIIFFKSGIGSVIREWVSNGCSDSVEFIASVLTELYGL